MEQVFRELAGYIALGLEVFSVLLIAVGAIESALLIIVPFVRRTTTPGTRRGAWLNMGRWLLVGLEFMLAADIVRTAISPNWQDIGQLAAIAVIRTFLNFFLERELDKRPDLEAQAQKMGNV